MTIPVFTYHKKKKGTDFGKDMARVGKTLLVYGGSGALGRAIVNRFGQSGWRVHSVDVTDNPKATINTRVVPTTGWFAAAHAVAQSAGYVCFIPIYLPRSIMLLLLLLLLLLLYACMYDVCMYTRVRVYV